MQDFAQKSHFPPACNIPHRKIVLFIEMLCHRTCYGPRYRHLTKHICASRTAIANIAVGNIWWATPTSARNVR